MAINLTSGRTKNCNTPISGGVQTVHIAETADIDVVTTGVNGEATGVTMTATNVFYKYEFAANTAVFTESTTNENCASQTTQTLTMNWRGRSQADRNSIQELLNSCCGLTVIHKENTGVSKIWGYTDTEEAYLTTVESTTGTAKSDANESILTLQALATSMCIDFTGAVPV